MKIMVTGGLGALGQHISSLLVEKGHDAIAFDLETKITKKTAKESPHIKIKYGNITEPETYIDMLPEVDAIIHMAFILPPGSESNPFAYKVNVEGTKNLIEALEEKNPNCRLVFASSVTVFGPTMWQKPPITIERPMNPTDRYSTHKAICEQAIEKSKLNNWAILRIAEAMYLNISLSPENLNRMYEIPYDQRMEFIHPHDVAIAFTNAAILKEGSKEKFIIGGGKSCQTVFHEQVERILAIFNLPPPKKEKFSTQVYYTDWYDTTRSQELFKYQTKTFNDYLVDFEDSIGKIKDVIKFFSPIAKYFI